MSATGIPTHTLTSQTPSDPIATGTPGRIALEHDTGLQAGENTFPHADNGALDAGDGIRRSRIYQEAAGPKREASLVDELAHTRREILLGAYESTTNLDCIRIEYADCIGNDFSESATRLPQECYGIGSRCRLKSK